MTTQTQNKKVGGAKVPVLRFPEFSGEWEDKKLREMFVFKNGVNASKEQYGRGYRFINVLDIIENDFITHTKIRGSVDISEQEFLKHKVEYGDILFQRSSETREEVGQANVYLDKEVPATFGGFVIMGKKISDYFPVFMNYLLRTSSVRKDITSRSGGSTRYNIGQESLEKVTVATPGKEEQQKIAGFLGVVDEKIDVLSKKKASLERYKKGVMQKIFSQEIRFKDESGNSYPDWEEKRLGEIGEIIGGGTPDTANTSLWNGKINWFTPTEIKQKYVSTSARNISAEGLRSSSAKLLPVGTLLLTTRATIGDISILKCEATTNQGFQSIVVNKENSNDFVYYWILKNKKEFLRRANGSTFAEISGKEVKKIKGTFPSLPEQQKIADFLTSLDEKISVIGNELSRAKEFKKGLLHQMFV